MRALHFSKGCYLGQEIVERIRSRGNVHRHLRQLELDGPLPKPGTELLLDGAAGGQYHQRRRTAISRIRTRRFALAMIRSEAEVKNQPLTYGDNGGNRQESCTATRTVIEAVPAYMIDRDGNLNYERHAKI